jgi:hypothetical protein
MTITQRGIIVRDRAHSATTPVIMLYAGKSSCARFGIRLPFFALQLFVNDNVR